VDLAYDSDFDGEDYDGAKWHDLSAHAANLEPDQVRAVLLRCEGESVARIADELGVSQRSVFRWFSRDDVAGFYADVQARLFTADLAEIQALRVKAIRALGAALDARPVEPHTIRAAKEILDRTGMPAVKEVRRAPVAARDPKLAALSPADLRRALAAVRAAREVEE
jgi:AcrR family transcriptional regulator